MGSGVFGIGVGAIQNAQFGLLTTEHNIANAHTAGYSRQRVIQTSNIAVQTGSGFIGQGAHVSTIERMYDGYIGAQINNAQANVSELEAYSSEISQINSMLADPNAGLSSAMTAFFKGIQQVAADPSSLTARQSMVSSAEAMISRFQGLEQRISEQYDSVNSQIEGYVSSINSYAQQIANLNERIILSQSATSQPPNDLLDQRDQLVAELNTLIKVSTTTNSDGTFNVYIGNGQQLVTRTQVSELTALGASADTSRVVVGLKTPSGNLELPESLITGGSLGGLLEFRSEFLDRTANDLGRIAVSMALTFNAQQALGQDLTGKIAGDTGFVSNFFTVPTPKVVANSLNPATAPNVTVSYISPPPYDGNFYTDLTSSDYLLESNGSPVTLKLTRLSDNAFWTGSDVTTLNANIALSAQGSQGFEIATSGAFVAGSTYLIQPTREAARNIAINPTIEADVRQIAVAAPIRTSVNTSNTGNATISAGAVGPNYSVADFPVTLTYNSGSPPTLTGFPASAYPVTVEENGTTTSFASGAVTYTTGATITFSGISFEISGTPKDGDKFEITRNNNGVSDGRNVLLMGKLQTQSTMSGQTATFLGTYAQLVSDAGNKGREVNTTLQAQQSLLEQSQSARDSFSGVNLDEEAANLLMYQQAYQAAAKMIEIGSKLFDSILAIG